VNPPGVPQDERQAPQPARRIVPEGDVQVRERDGKPDDFAPPHGERHEVGHGDRLQLLGEVIDLGLGERDEAQFRSQAWL